MELAGASVALGMARRRTTPRPSSGSARPPSRAAALCVSTLPALRLQPLANSTVSAIDVGNNRCHQHGIILVAKSLTHAVFPSPDIGSSGFLVGRCELGCRIPFPSPSYDSRSVLAVKGSLLRAKRAPLTAPGRSEAHNLYEGKGIRGTSHLSTISASAPQSAFHRSTVLKCGRLLARSWPVPPTRNPEEPGHLLRHTESPGVG